jgi:hypothetical protein
VDAPLCQRVLDPDVAWESLELVEKKVLPALRTPALTNA